jgi:hypothetical protein
MLKQKIQSLDGGFELWELTPPLPCCQILENGQVCLRDARYAIVNPRRADEYVVYPYCDEHLPRKASLTLPSGKIKEGSHSKRKGGKR